MHVEVRPSRGRETVGPPDGPHVRVPAGFTISVTEHGPCDLRMIVEWDDVERRLALREATFIAAGDEPVRMASIIRVAIGELMTEALESEILGERGWEGVVEDHPDAEPERVDALVYLLSVAVGSPKPSANVALARGLSPASGPKRVGHARKLGLIPETASGKASAGLSTFTSTARHRGTR